MRIILQVRRGDTVSGVGGTDEVREATCFEMTCATKNRTTSFLLSSAKACQFKFFLKVVLEVIVHIYTLKITDHD